MELFYSVTCEISRTGIIEDLLKVPVVLIRFNPALRQYSALKNCVLQYNLTRFAQADTNFDELRMVLLLLDEVGQAAYVNSTERFDLPISIHFHSLV